MEGSAGAIGRQTRVGYVATAAAATAAENMARTAPAARHQAGATFLIAVLPVRQSRCSGVISSPLCVIEGGSTPHVSRLG